mgnify:CR=1 FL=1
MTETTTGVEKGRGDQDFLAPAARLRGAGTGGLVELTDLERSDRLARMREGSLGSVHSWELVTAVDGPGTRMTTFLAGCPLRCLYCHNPDTMTARRGVPVLADDLLAKNPQSALAQNVRLQAYANKKDYAKVIELGQAAADVQTDPADKSLMYYLLGAAYNAKEMKPQAIAAFKQVTDGPAAENAKAALAELSK